MGGYVSLARWRKVGGGTSDQQGMKKRRCTKKLKGGSSGNEKNE